MKVNVAAAADDEKTALRSLYFHSRLSLLNELMVVIVGFDVFASTWSKTSLPSRVPTVVADGFKLRLQIQ